MFRRLRRTLPAALVLSTLSLPAAAGSAHVDWPAYGGGSGRANYSPLRDINAANVAQLRLAWQWRTGETALKEVGTSPGMFQTTPIVIDGVMYLSTPYNRVVALNPTTGQQIWSYDPKAYVEGQVLNGTGFVHRGVAAWRDPKSHLEMRGAATITRLSSSTYVRRPGHEGLVGAHAHN